MSEHKRIVFDYWVGIIDYTFVPATIYFAQLGDYIIFENRGTKSYTIKGYAESPSLLPGQAFQVILKDKGIKVFTIEEYPNMEFQVSVEEIQDMT